MGQSGWLGQVSLSVSSVLQPAIEQALIELEAENKSAANRVSFESEILEGRVSDLALFLRYVVMTPETKMELYRLRRTLIQAATDLALPEMSQALIEQLNSPNWNERPERMPSQNIPETPITPANTLVFGNFGPHLGMDDYLGY